MKEAQVSYRRMKQVQQNKETFLVGVRATEQLQKVAEVDSATLMTQFEEAIKGAEDAKAAGDEAMAAKFVKKAQLLNVQMKKAKSVTAAEQVAPVVDHGPPPLTRTAEGVPRIAPTHCAAKLHNLGLRTSKNKSSQQPQRKRAPIIRQTQPR